MAEPETTNHNHEDPRNGNDYVLDDIDEDPEAEAEAMPRFDVKASQEAKLRELLCNINSTEPKLASDSTKELSKLFRDDFNGELLRYYVTMSVNLTEIREVWKQRRGKPELSRVMRLVYVILDHPEGKYKADDRGRIVVSKALDRFGKGVLEEGLEDVYKELNSKDGKRQRKALLLMAAVVRRGSVLADEVARSFDFKMPVLSKLAEWKRRGKKGEERKGKGVTRNAFIEFAMSFVEMGKPGLLKWVLQQKEIFSGVLRGIGGDDLKTVVYVLSILRDRVLVPESLIPPGLRSVLFGSVTLEQLARISGRDSDELDAKIAHEVLLMACIDPSNGLMPDANMSSLKGNQMRLLGLMKKLRATDVKNHQALLSAIVKGRPSLGSAYLDEFPYNLEDHSSATWVDAASLAADLVLSVRTGISWDFLRRLSDKQAAFQDSDLQSVLKCICPSPFSRLVVNKGLLHSNPLINHGTLRLLLENLKLLDSLIDALSLNELTSLRQEIQNEVRVLLPDPQVLFGLLSSLSNKHGNSQTSLKRVASSEPAELEECKIKKHKMDAQNDDIDILVGGVNFPSNSDALQDSDMKMPPFVKNAPEGNNHQKEFAVVWGLNQCSTSSSVEDNADVHFHCKLLEVLKIYHRILHTVLELSYDFFKMVPSNPLALPSTLLQAILSVLVDCVIQPSKFGASRGSLQPFYKYLQQFLHLFLFSPVREIKDEAYVLARAAVISTGAFDSNEMEVGAWFLFLPGYNEGGVHAEEQECELFRNLSPVIISFLCDAVSTIGNNLIKYWDRVKYYCYRSEASKDSTSHFSPLVICVLDKCVRLLSAQATILTLPERTMISLYVSNTLKYLIQIQVDPKLLSSVVHRFLSESLEGCFLVDDLDSISCEWRPLKYLFSCAQNILNQGICYTSSLNRNVLCSNSSFASLVYEVEELLRRGCRSDLFGVSKAFYFALICAAPNEIMENMSSVLMISENLLGVRPLITSLLFLDPFVFSSIYKLSPDILSSILETGAIPTIDELKENDHIGSAFCSLLSQAPFHVLLPSFAIGGAQKHYSKMKEFLSIKLSRLTTYLLFPSMMFTLSCIRLGNLYLERNPAIKSQDISEVCYALVENILRLLVKDDTGFSTDGGSSVSIHHRMHICKTIFSHPAIISALSYCNEPVEGLLWDILKGIASLSGERTFRKNRAILSLLIEACDFLFGFCSSQKSVTADGGNSEKISKAFGKWNQQLLRERLDLYLGTLDLNLAIPALYIIRASMRYLSPFDLLELVYWLFSRAELQEAAEFRNYKVSPYHLGFCIAGGAFEMLSSYFCLPNKVGAQGDLLLESKGHSSDAMLLKTLYFKAVEFSTRYKLEVADIFLLKFVTVAHGSEHRQDHLPICMKMARVIASTPTEIIHHFIDKISPVKSKLLLYFIETSPLHMSAFGRLLLCTLSGSSMEGSGKCHISKEGYLMLLPAALSYIESAVTKCGSQHAKKLDSLISFYLEILITGFTNWKGIVDQAIFHIEYAEELPSSSMQLLDLANNSLLGKSVRMLQCLLTLNKVSLDERLMGLCELLPLPSSEFLDLNIRNLDSDSADQLLNSMNRIVANIRLSKMLLFIRSCQNQLHPKEEQDAFGQHDTLSIREGPTLKLIDSLVSIWKSIVKKTSSACDTPEKGKLLFKFLEVFVLRSIYELIMEMRDALVQLDSLPFLEEIVKVSLLHRFGDLSTLELLQRMVSALSEGNSLPVSFLQLLLSHSQLGRTILTNDKSVSCDVVGVLLKPIFSILRPVHIPAENETSTSSTQKLEVVKLLRMLFYLKSHRQKSAPENDIGINTRGLLSLLLSSYGATLSDIDLEIYSLMVVIESANVGCGKLTELDYLWGSALLRSSGDQMHECDSFWLDLISDMEGDTRKSTFRDNLPIDPKLCIATILHFPFERTASDDPLSSEKFLLNNNGSEPETHSSGEERIKCYDPVFILRFSIHCLSMDFLDCVEFTGLGLLAIALMSISSPDVGIRKLGYDVLVKFKDGLEKCRKKRDSTRLRLLLTCLQNSIPEQCQKIPSTIAVFVAESSLILLDPSNDRFASINKYLMQSSRINMKLIPLFHDYFWSSSVHFKKDRIWMLSLLCAGMNSEEDSRLFIKGSVPEILLSFYVSPLSDDESKELILQILKKSIKSQNMSRYLVKNCSLIPWISSVLSSLGPGGDQDIFFLKQLMMLIEVANGIVLSKGIPEWLLSNALEQLSDLSFHLHKILVNCSKYFGKTCSSKLAEKDLVVVSLLRVLVVALEISQKREAGKPRYTPSLRNIYDLYQAVGCDSKCSLCAELALKVVLICTPPVTIFDLDQEELSLFLSWADSTAMMSDSNQVRRPKECCPDFTTHARKDECRESSLSKLIRWITASAILGLITCKYKEWDSGFLSRVQNSDTLLSFLKYLEEECEGTKIPSGSAEILATVIFYLQQRLGGKGKVLRSVVAALSLLLLNPGSSTILSPGSPVPSLCSRIRCPLELNPMWRWSYDQPWVGTATEQTDLEKLDESQACQSLLVIISGFLEKCDSDTRHLSYQDLENSGVFQWERSMLYVDHVDKQ